MAKTNKKQSSAKRTRLWMTIGYPESLPANWEDLLCERLSYGKWTHSPLHDGDVNATGEEKKPHYHILMVFDGVKTYEQIKEILEPLNATEPKVCQSFGAMVRYFIHADNPEKCQYKREDIKAFGGLDVDSPFTTTADWQETQFKQIYDIIRDNQFFNIIDLEQYFVENNLTELQRYTHTNTFLVNAYLNGMYQKLKSQDLYDKKHDDLMRQTFCKE